MANRPTLIETEDHKLRFLVLDAPSDTNLASYLKEFKKHNVTHLARLCQPTYNSQPVIQAGIKFYEMPFDDGKSPPKNIVNAWLSLVDEVFPDKKKQQHDQQQEENGNGTSSSSADRNGRLVADRNGNNIPPTIGVHCVAGLGRAPVLVAIALMERENMNALDSIRYVRKRRRGAINTNQITFIEKYVPRRKKPHCIVM